MDRKRHASMRLPPAFSRVNRSSGRVPKVMTGNANVSVSGRAPGAVWPESSPENCEDFLNCVGGKAPVTLGAKLGECCTKWSSDTVVQDTYCQVPISGGYQVPFSSICGYVRGQGEKDEDQKANVENLGLTFSDVVAACDAACNSVPPSQKPGFCDARALRDCLESPGSSEGLCCGKYYNSAGYVSDKCDGTTFGYATDCLQPDGVVPLGRGQLCKDFCDNINKDILIWYNDWDRYCGEPQAFRECVRGTDLGKCCALHPDMVIDCAQPLFSGCFSDPSTKGSFCNSYCTNIDPYASKSDFRCRPWGYATCTAAAASQIVLPHCCAYQPDSWDEHCGLSVHDPRYEEGYSGYETRKRLTELCDDLRNPLGSGVPCGLEVSKSTLEGYCTTLCNSLDQSTRRSENFWWCDVDAYVSYLACTAGVDVDEYLEDRRRVPTYHSRHFSYEPYKSLEDWAGDLGHAWEEEAKCCGENPTAAACGERLRLCEQLYDSKYDDQRDEIDDFEFPEIEEFGREQFSTAAEFCRTICKNIDDEPEWCDNVPARRLLAGEIAAIVLGCFLFVAIVGIVVLVILYIKKPGVGGAPSAG